MFTTSVTGGKAFAAAQKISELKTRISKLNAQKLKLSHAKIIEILTVNMNLKKSKKYGFAPEDVERKSLSNKRFKTQGLHNRLDKYDKKKNSLKKR